jgi:hypothetical protein
MDKQETNQLLIEDLLMGEESSTSTRAAVVAKIASARPLIAELDELSTLLTGEPSQLQAQAAQLLTCNEALARLPAYVEEQVAGVEVAGRYPQMADHLVHCPACREQASLLADLLQTDTLLAPAPTYLNFAEWFAQQAPVTSAQGESPARWQQITQQLHRFVVEIPILIQEGRARFGNLTHGLKPQLAPAIAYRTIQASERDYAQLVALPHPEANLVVRIRLGPIVEAAGTLLLEIAQITPSHPVAHARVLLRTDDGALLEAALSDADGLVIFRQLEVGRYQLHVEHNNQIWVVAVSLFDQTAT